ncbi:hypothetical protein EDB84DRAFT_901338 [Lactarius hengduanensis]|nr:hypothetical protein EDB84DRAFT_901338 [Lactarius hengduanensis]
MFVSILRRSTNWTKTWRAISQSRDSAHASSQLETPRSESPTLKTTLSLNSNHAAVAIPTEILRAIFLCCVGVPGSPVESFTASHVHPPNWIAITQVCQRWRSVALGINELWTVITRDLSPEWIVAFLQRSSYAPAQIMIDISPRSPLRRPLIDSKRRSRATAFDEAAQYYNRGNPLSHITR